MVDGEERDTLAILFRALDACTECQEFTKRVATTPDKWQPRDLLGFGRIGKKLVGRAQQEPRSYDLSRAMSASRDVHRALTDLSEFIEDDRLGTSTRAAETWPDRIYGLDGQNVFNEVTEVLTLLVGYRRNADLGKPLAEER